MIIIRPAETTLNINEHCKICLYFCSKSCSSRYFSELLIFYPEKIVQKFNDYKSDLVVDLKSAIVTELVII